MKTHGILQNDLARMVARMGHADLLVITDRGFPFPSHERTECIDISIGRDIPKVTDVLKIILEELEIEKVIIANETKTICQEEYKKFQEILEKKKNKGNDIIEENIPHMEFKDLVLNGALEGKEGKKVTVFVKTGEFTPYCNIILQSGVDF
ncbi:D-ribose pyranase [Vallitalea guaymasensis]|uniref:D-ribose pyranase n=1 Tax=Vallitalea guaymasensis TaxID=1185412 RepID=A0A8J8MCP5_9FIRM|nr:D-ribose pyranase [Vallitalea guaymasensis]QUH30526.1 D-ribose pyranase [Vallitalea guaymasensis]